MVSLGPLPMSAVVLMIALAIASAVGWRVARSTPDRPSVEVVPTILNMLFVGMIAARLGFVLEWLPQYLSDPWSIIRIGDGGLSVWAGAIAALAFGFWQAHRAKPLRRPLALAVIAGLTSWAFLGGALTQMQQSVLKLPTSELATLDGATTNLSVMSGKPMVVNLWATWCPPCRREMPVLANAQALRDDVTFALVNQGESEQVVRDYLRSENLQLRNLLLDVFSSVAQEAGSRGLPTTLFFDADGQLVDIHMGELSEASLTRKLQRFRPASAMSP